MLVPNPLVLNPNISYTFRSYFEMKFAPSDILADLGCTLTRSPLQLPQAEWKDIEVLQQRIEAYLPYVSLTSEAARREVLVAPIILELTQAVNTSVEIEYTLEVNQYLKGELDYYLKNERSLLVVEAKNADLGRGFVQLAVQLIALNLWLAKRQGVPTLENSLFGAVTTGDIWQFGCYNPTQHQIAQDIHLYRVPDDLISLAKTLKGILMV